MNENYLISIITINFNNVSGLSSTIDSVFEQTYNNIQYIVIDGGSTDGSSELIEKNKNKFFYSVSEKDNGIYHAMNKGLSKATGDYILILNSGDLLLDKNVISKVNSLILRGSEIVACDLFYSNKNRLYRKFNPQTISVSYFMNHVLYHPALLIARNVYEKYGFYNESFKIASDWEFTLKTAGIAGCSYQHIPVFLSVFDMNGISSKNEYRFIQNNEKKIALELLFDRSVIQELSCLQTILDEKRQSFSEIRKRQLLNIEGFYLLKTKIRQKPNFILFFNILFSMTSIMNKKLAFKMLIQKLFS
jgi:glycosyltransferase involved in cell wall biosynthesis